MATNNANDFSNPIAISQGGTNATSMATNDGTAYFDGTRVVVTATGTTGQQLTSNGPGLAPTYQSHSSGGGPSGQGWDLIGSQTSSAAAINFTGLTNKYNTYAVVYSHGIPAELAMRYSTNNGVSYVTTGYRSTASRIDMTGGGTPTPDTNNSYVILNVTFAASAATASIAYLFNVTSGERCTVSGFGCGDRTFSMLSATLGNAAPINALTFFGSGIGFGGTVRISLYGINE